MPVRVKPDGSKYFISEVRRIDDLCRLQLPRTLCDMLNVHELDKFEISFDEKTSTIMLKHKGNKDVLLKNAVSNLRMQTENLDGDVLSDLDVADLRFLLESLYKSKDKIDSLIENALLQISCKDDSKVFFEEVGRGRYA